MSEINKSDSDEKRSSVFQEKVNRGDTAELTDSKTADTSMMTKKVVTFSGKNRGDTLSCRLG